MNYYNPYYDEIKDDRIEITLDTTINDIKIIKGILHSKNNYVCPYCGSVDYIKYGHKDKKIKIDVLKHYKTEFTLTVNRFLCKNCLKTFIDSTSLTSKNSSISIQTKFSVLEDLRRDISFTEISKRNNVSIQTVINLFEANVNLPRNKLPEVICIDEFKNLKSSTGKYAFLILDPNEHKIIDVLHDRKLNNLESYFLSIPREERNGVKYVISDMYEGYRTIIKYHFPNATHIIDRFHYIRYVTQAFNNIRIKIMSSFKDTDIEYKTLKRYWRLFLMENKLLDSNLIYDFKTQTKIETYKLVEQSLNFHPSLENAYSILQDFYILINDTKYEDADVTLDNWINSLSECEIKEFKDLSKMFKNWKNEIKNSFLRFGDKHLSNGPIEGMNNHIKVIKRIGFGFKNFNHFRNRIMYIINNVKVKIK